MGPHDEGMIGMINEWWKSQGRAPYRALKLKFLEHFTTCYWCSDPVIDYIPPAGEPVKVPDNAATVDHTVSRFFREKGTRVKKVLACNKCNQRRAREENKLYTTAHNERKANLRRSVETDTG